VLLWFHNFHCQSDLVDSVSFYKKKLPSRTFTVLLFMNTVKRDAEYRWLQQRWGWSHSHGWCGRQLMARTRGCTGITQMLQGGSVTDKITDLWKVICGFLQCNVLLALHWEMSAIRHTFVPDTSSAPNHTPNRTSPHQHHWTLMDADRNYSSWIFL